MEAHKGPVRYLTAAVAGHGGEDDSMIIRIVPKIQLPEKPAGAYA